MVLGYNTQQCVFYATMECQRSDVQVLWISGCYLQDCILKVCIFQSSPIHLVPAHQVCHITVQITVYNWFAALKRYINTQDALNINHQPSTINHQPNFSMYVVIYIPSSCMVIVIKSCQYHAYTIYIRCLNWVWDWLSTSIYSDKWMLKSQGRTRQQHSYHIHYTIITQKNKSLLRK